VGFSIVASASKPSFGIMKEKPRQPFGGQSRVLTAHLLHTCFNSSTSALFTSVSLTLTNGLDSVSAFWHPVAPPALQKLAGSHNPLDLVGASCDATLEKSTVTLTMPVSAAWWESTVRKLSDSV